MTLPLTGYAQTHTPGARGAQNYRASTPAAECVATPDTHAGDKVREHLTYSSTCLRVTYIKAPGDIVYIDWVRPDVDFRNSRLVDDVRLPSSVALQALPAVTGLDNPFASTSRLKTFTTNNLADHVDLWVTCFATASEVVRFLHLGPQLWKCSHTRRQAQCHYHTCYITVRIETRRNAHTPSSRTRFAASASPPDAANEPPARAWARWASCLARSSLRARNRSLAD